MKVPVFCVQCRYERLLEAGYPAKMMEVSDSGIFEIKCDNGHSTVIALENEKFELLSRMAVEAIIDGYYRDSIVSFSASLERLHELFLKAVCIKSSLNITSSELDSTWKVIKNQTERQLGGFLVAYLIETGQAAPTLKDEIVKMRNKVVHKGYFPTYSDAVCFGKDVLRCAFIVLDLLNTETYKNALNNIKYRKHFDCIDGLHKKIKTKEHVNKKLPTDQRVETPLSFSNQTEQRSMEEIIEHYTKLRSAE